VALMGIGPLARWKEDESQSVLRRMLVPGVAAVLAFVLCATLAPRFSAMACVSFAFAAWLACGIVDGYRDRLRHASGLASTAAKWKQIPIAYHGMQIAHLGVVAFILGVTAVKSFEQEYDIALSVGQSKSVAGVDIKFLGVNDVPGPNYNAKVGKFSVSRDGVELRTLKPERRFYASNRAMPMTEAAIDRGLRRDIYVSLGDDLGGGSWTVRVHYKPLVNWIWLGCVIMALGGLLGALDPRYRRARQTAPLKANNVVGAN